MTNVTISGLTITNTPASAYPNIAVAVIAGSMSNVAFKNITIREQPALVPAFSLWAPYTASGFTMNGTPINA